MESNLEKIQNMMKDKNSDLKIEDNELDEKEEKKEKKRLHKKPLALKELENKDRLMSLKKKNLKETKSDDIKHNDMKDLLEKETSSIFHKPWNKLEKGLKYNRVNVYIDDLETEHTLTEGEKTEVKKLLFSSINKGGLTKNVEVNYSKDNAKIEKINTLLFDDKKRKFSIKKEQVKKPKSTGKSKSNLQRFMKH